MGSSIPEKCLFKMKLNYLLFAIILAALFSGGMFAQNKIVILVRHAEKQAADAMSATASNPDPDLSAAGKERAERLVKLVGKHKPNAFYSTNYKRTRETLEPFAARRHKSVQI